MIALIPARAGSKRIPGKNTKLFFGHLLIAYTIQTAKDSGLFERILVCTDSDCVGGLVFDRFTDVAVRWRGHVSDSQPDIVWVKEALEGEEKRYETFCILRPTSPFRTVDMLNRAWHVFTYDQTADSIRAVEAASQHPGKMWEWQGQGYPITPLMPRQRADGTPWHSSPTQSLPTYYVQNASLEMAWTRNVEVYGTISGRKVAPFFCHGYEGFDLNTERDWREAEYLVASGKATLPTIPLEVQARAFEALKPADPGWAMDK